ncbi:ABC transporter substrate-binding protein [Fodinicola acaciae]|uniref:ABC transporter substrate-binding protein n=1 Tax=Fodinicola acaciae TaxID=2681555 RepID=UPI0013D65A4C|nr:ABC transporter substrate-binding protein [Fodinicola acaciae]
MSLAVSLAACTGPSNKSASADSNAPSPPVPVVAQLPASDKPVATVSWVLPAGEPNTIDPMLAVDYSPDFVESNLCDSLLTQGSDFSIRPNLATATQVNPMTLQLTLRSGVKFWDGTALTVADVAYSLNRIKNNPDSPANYGFQFVKSVAVSGPNQVTVTFTQPNELFVKELATPTGAVIQQAYAAKAGAKFGTASGGVMCSGPYKLQSWIAGNSMTLVKNTSYWNPALQPKIATVKISFATDTSAITQGLLSGEFDGAYELPASVIRALTGASTGSVHLGASPQSLELNVTHPGGLIANTNLRKAIMTGIDRAALARAVYNGAAQPNYTTIAKTSWDPAALPIYKAAYAKFEKANAYNPTAAKAAVTASGYRGQTLNLGILAGDATQSAAAQIIQHDLDTIGIKLAIKQLQPTQYSQAGSQASGRAGLDLLLGNTFNQVADPLEFISLTVQKGGPFNYTNYDSQQTTNNINQALATFDPAKRAQLIIAAQDQYEATYGSTSLVNIYEISFLNKRLTGAITSFPYMFVPSLAYIGGK